MAGPLTLKVVAPDQTVFSGAVQSVIAPAWDGQVGILKGHAPMISLLGAGELILNEGSNPTVYHVAGGLMKVEGDNITVLTEYASDEPPSAELVKSLLGGATTGPAAGPAA